MKSLLLLLGFMAGRDASESVAEGGVGYIVQDSEITEAGALCCSLLNCLLNSRLAVVLLHFSNFDSAHDVKSVWFELRVNGRLWWTGRGCLASARTPG